MKTTGRFIVAMRRGAAEAARGSLTRAAGIRPHRPEEFGSRLRLSELAHGHALVLDDLDIAIVDSPRDQVAYAYAQAGGSILAFAPEGYIHAIDADTRRGSSASLVAKQSPSLSDEASFSWGLQRTRADLSRFTGRGVRVAVLDSGIDLKHPDFHPIPERAHSFIDDSNVQDRHGHGTHCAGVACGPKTVDMPPRYGYACEADLHVGRVLDAEGDGTDGALLAGMWWAQRMGCSVVSMSVGRETPPGEGPNWAVEMAARRLLELGVLPIAAAGNDSRRSSGIVAPVHFPASCPSIMAVGALDQRLDLVFSTNAGLDPNGGAIDIAAPGVNVRSAWLMPEAYHVTFGTSMATACVAGVAAMFAEASPNARGRALWDLLLAYAAPLRLNGRDVGAGLVQAP